MAEDMEPALLLRDFVNTLDKDEGHDQIQSPADLAGWLTEHGLAGRGASVSQAGLESALRLREALRAAMRAHHDDEAAATDELDTITAEHPLRVRMRGGRPVLEPASEAGGAGVTRIVAALVDSHAGRTWQRLKICPAADCEWAFLDTSKNRSRTWCSMRTCGARAKSTAYRARRRELR